MTKVEGCWKIRYRTGWGAVLRSWLRFRCWNTGQSYVCCNCGWWHYRSKKSGAGRVQRVLSPSQFDRMYSRV